jgi:uncharacterized iron-regulated protein
MFLLALHVPASRSTDELPSETWHQWQVIDVKTFRPIAFEEWMTRLAEQDVIYLGEEHRNAWHIEAALRILGALLERHRRPVLALEMFGWDGQAGLDQYLSEEQTSRDDFLAASRWEQNWGGAFEDYAPLITFAREHHLPVLALNPPRPLVRRVATLGLDRALADADMRRWGLQDATFVEDLAYRDVIVSQLRACHGGLSDEGYQRMYEASLFRDEGMARTIASYLSRPKAGTDDGVGPLVSYTGGGHIQYRVPVPNRVLRQAGGAVSQATVYMTSYGPDSPEEVNHLLRESIADYVWLTPVSAHGPSRRCR